MTIDEAIEILGIEDRRSYPKRRLEAHFAIKLDIEALEAWKENRQYFPLLECYWLPGETE